MYSISAVLGVLVAGLQYSIIVTGKLLYFWFSFLFLTSLIVLH